MIFRPIRFLSLIPMILVLSSCGGGTPYVELTGFASLAADTFSEGSPAGADNGSGLPISANDRTGPFSGQPVQGFSGVQFAPQTDKSFLFLTDNGFGAKKNSADYMLRIYKISPNFRTVSGGDGSVKVDEFIQLSDPDKLVPFPIIQENASDRLLTGADFDVESFVLDSNGDIWVGDEFGPYVLHFDATGKLLEAPITTPNMDGQQELLKDGEVRSPQNPNLVHLEDANLPASRGYEGMAFRSNGGILYLMLEGTVQGDPEGALRLYDFEVNRSGFKDLAGFYKMEDPGHAIGDLTPINNQEFLVIERDGKQGIDAKFKMIYKIDITKVDSRGFFVKEKLVDLLNISDPNDLNEDGNTLFNFPFVTIENVLVLNEETILVANDNNYPFSVGRGPDIDNNEIIMLRLNKKLRININ